MVAAQETYMTAAKHKEDLEDLAQSLDQQLESARGPPLEPGKL